MSDSTQQPGGGPAPRDPWAPPDSGVDLGKQGAQTPPPAGHTPPAVHDQPTVTSMPSAGERHRTDTPGRTRSLRAPSDVPPPPVGPNGPGYAGQPPIGEPRGTAA